MKISFVCQDFAGGQGVDYATAIIARGFFERGWDVDILVSQVHRDYLNEGRKAFPVPATVNLVYMPSRRASRNGLFLRRYLKTCGSDFVIAESGEYTWCVRWASFGIRKRSLPKLVQVNHGDVDMLKGWKLLKTRFKFWFLYRKFAALLFVNDQSNRNFKVMYYFLRELRTGTVNNACVDSVFWDKVKLVPTHKWLLKKECPTFVAAGAYQPYKDHMVILRALKMVREAGQHVRVIIFGRGPLETLYREYIVANNLEDYASVGGYTDRLPAEIRASDGFILSSNWESFGIVLAEGLATGVPCIATDAPYGPREILADGEYGRLVPVNDEKAMAEAIVDCAAGKIPAAPKESWQRYTIAATMQKYLVGIGKA